MLSLLKIFTKSILSQEERVNLKSIDLNYTKFSVYKIEEFKNGVKVSVKNSESGNIAMILKGGEPTVFGLKECEESLLGLRS